MAKKIASPLSYLGRVRLPPSMKGDGVWKYITNMRVVVLLVVTILFLGLASYFSIPRRLNPEIKIPIVTVITVLAGASPADVESLVTIPLETALQNVTGVDTMNSVSRDNVSVISLQFISSVTPEKAKADVQSAVDGVTALPQDAQTPAVKALDFEDRPIWTFAVSSTTNDIPSLMRFSKDLKKKLEETQKVDRVIVNGYDEQVVSVALLPEKMSEYGISPLSLAGAIKTSLSSYPSGTVDTTQNSFSITIDPSVTSVDDLRNLAISVSGKKIHLADVATVMERSKARQTSSFLGTPGSDQRQVVTFSVYKVSGANIDEAERHMQDTVQGVLVQAGDRFRVQTIVNTASEMTNQFTDLLGEFRSTILLVFACLLLFLGLRQALIASVTVPLTFLSAFVFMRYFGMSINFLSLFAFLLALGLLVDDTIVTVSAMTTYFKTGRFSPQETGRIVWKDTIVPIWSTTITTIWSFVPLLLSTGIIGEFIKPIPIVVTVTMISSTAIAVLVTLPFMIVLLKPSVPTRVVILFKVMGIGALTAVVLWLLWGNPLFFVGAMSYGIFLFVFPRAWVRIQNDVTKMFRSHGIAVGFSRVSRVLDTGLISTEKLSASYFRLMKRILSSRWARRFVIWTIVLYSVLSFLLVPLGFVKNEFFPKSNEDVLYVNLELPAGTNSDRTTERSLEILQTLTTVGGVQFVTDDIGVLSQTSSYTGGSSGNNYASFTLHLIPKEHRAVSSVDIAESLRKQFAKYTDGKLSVVEESSGPPAGSDLQMTIRGDDLEKLNAYADSLVSYLSSQKGTIDAKKSVKPGTSKLVFVPDQTLLSQYGLTTDGLGLWLRTFASGFSLSDAKYEKDTRSKKDIVLYYGNGRSSPSDLWSLSIPTQSFGPVPLSSLGSFVLEQSPTAITRQSGKRSITISASVRPGYNVTELNRAFESYVKSLSFDSGYSWKTGGVNDENQKSVQSILQSMVVAFILILVTMVIQFQSYRQAVIVLLVIPLAVSSVFVVFALTGTPLSFPALIGVLSLFGIVVTNSMFIVDKINLNLKERMPFVDAIADAGASRMEPIILTKLCTVFGLLPITISNALWRGLGGAIISGLLIASTIMLLFIPAVYYEWFSKKET